MYIIKNALRCIGRSKARNVLIAIIVLVIAVSACLGLSIRQAAITARQDALENLNITATISFDRRGAMSGMAKPSENGQMQEGGFDRDKFSEMMGASSALTLEEYEKYAKADSVKDFYYEASISLNGSDELLPVSNETDSSAETERNSGNQFGGGRAPGSMDGGMMSQIMGAQSDFTIVGYSSEAAMTSFINGTSSITDGEVFAEGTEEYECIISEELATYNELSVGDSITLLNPNNEEEAYTLSIKGIYTDSSANENSFSMMGMTSNDPANQIYTSYAVIESIVDKSSEISETVTDDNTGREFETGLKASLSATYVFADIESYERFSEQVVEMGLSDSYTVSSSDISSFENSLAPLDTLSQTAGYFLVVILIIGGIILIVLNIFNVRERKYEIGVLTAMGMKKGKVALQFVTEIFAVTLVAVLIGAGIGSVTAVPVTNTLLQNQTVSQQNRFDAVEQNFGRGEMPDGMGGEAPQMQGGKNPFGQVFDSFGSSASEAITEITSATNFTVLLQMLGIAVLLTLVAGAVSMLFIMRYEPLRILSNRD